LDQRIVHSGKFVTAAGVSAGNRRLVHYDAPAPVVPNGWRPQAYLYGFMGAAIFGISAALYGEII
jgi:hypothetical protein